MNTESYSEKLLPSLVIALFLMLQIVSYFFIQRIVFDISFIIIGFIVFIFQVKYIFNKQFLMFLMFSLVAVYGLYITFIEHRIGSMVPLRLIMHFAILTLMIRYRISARIIKLVLYGYVGYVLFLIFILGVPLNGILPAASENFVGWMALGLAICYYVLLYKNNGKMEVHTAFLILIFAIICIGRSTILGSILLLLAIFYDKLKRQSVFLKIIIVSALLFFTIAVYFNISLLSSILPFFNKFQEKGLNLDGRDMMIFGYFDKINLYTFFTGVTPRQYPFTILHENFHNSFLAVHSQFGIFGFIFILFLLWTIIFKYFKQPFLVMMLLIICLRSFTDTIAFVGLFDFLIYYIIYLIWNKNLESPAFKTNRITPETI